MQLYEHTVVRSTRGGLYVATLRGARHGVQPDPGIGATVHLVYCDLMQTNATQCLMVRFPANSVALNAKSRPFRDDHCQLSFSRI